MALSSALAAEGPSQPPADDADLTGLMRLLDEETQLATKRRTNIDYLPGMISVLSGEEMLVRGARTVWQALALVPGISQGMEFTGERQVLVRGVGHGYASGQVKILLDGQSMNSTLLATANPVLNMPIEQVERIEVVRGPGSSVYGEFAYAAVINVITRRGERSLRALAGTGEQWGGGLLWSWRDEEKDLFVSLNLMVKDEEGPEVWVERDALHTLGRRELSNAPGRSNESAYYQGFLVDLGWQGWLLSAKWLDDGYGDHLGINHFLPPSDSHLASWNRYRTLSLGRDLSFSDTLSARVRLEALSYERDRDRLFVFPAGFLGDEAVTMDSDYQENKYLGAVDLHWRPVPEHELLFGVEGTRVNVKDASWDWRGLPFELAPSWMDLDRHRGILSLLAQDQYRFSDQFTFTATLRYDNYSDVGGYLSPRLAAVWRIDEANILKFQFAKAFRPPTFYELQYPARGQIEGSEIGTFELGYLFKQPTWEARLGIFLSNLSDPIIFDELLGNGFSNGDDARLYGFELEYRQHLGRSWKIDANLSYVDAEIRSTGDPLPGGAQWLGNLALLWQPEPAWTAALQLQYVGERARAPQDPRDPISAQTVLDFTLSYRPEARGPFASLGVKNLTDAEVHFSDQLIADYEKRAYLPFPNDYPRPGRQWWLSVGYRF